MFTIEEIKNKKQMKAFVDFANDLYKGVPQYVPPIYGDEVGLINPKKNPSILNCKARFWVCKDDKGEIVGRIGGILQPAYNENEGRKTIRFTRFDVIDNIEITKLLFNEIYKFAKEEGMEQIHGPLGFNDFEREGLVVEGFQYIVTSQNEYNFEYYKTHLEKLGFIKEADWLEYRILVPDGPDERYERISEVVMKRYNLHEATEGLNTAKVVNKYIDQIFDLLNDCYGKLHGYVPITEEVQKQLATSFKLAINKDFISLVCDENDNLVALGVALSSLSFSLQKCGGKLFPIGFIPMLKTLKKPKVLELAFIAVKEEYRKLGVNAVVMNKILKSAVKNNIPYAESNCVLENNLPMQAVWAKWDKVNHRRRRCYLLEKLPDVIE